MKVIHLLEANVAAKIKDPKTIKMIGIAMRHDATLPKNKVAALGSSVFRSESDPAKQEENNQKLLNLWSELLDNSLRSTDYGDISADGKFDDWLTRLYMNGILDYEDINGEGGDALGAWKALSIRGKLKPEHQDFNRFKNLRQLQSIIQSREYRNELEKIKDQETIERHKRERKEVELIDDERYLVVVPMNYGSCYTFNNSAGFKASFCTGSSSGATWFDRYAKDGPVISVVDKDNYEDVNGKWQIHAPTNQINNGNQTVRRDEKFAELFPGLMKKIVAAIKSKAAEIKDASKEIVPGGYDVGTAIEDLKQRFPLSFASGEEEKKDDEEVDQDQGPGTYVVTLTRNGKQARIEGESKEDIINRVIERHPSLTRDDFTVEKVREQN
jgi:hypothetical protein